MLALVNNESDARLWSVKSPNGEFESGFLFGAYYGLAKLAQEHEYRFVEYPSLDDWTVEDTAMGLLPAMTYEQLMTRYNNMPTDVKTFNSVIVVRSPIITQLMYMVYVSGSMAAYLQGMFTALQAFNIPITEVLLTKPMLNKTYFDIEGLQLPRVPL